MAFEKTGETTASVSLKSEDGQPPAVARHEDIAAAIAQMMYISESEAPLELMDWPEVTGLPSLQEKIGEQMQLPAASQVIMTADDFLAGIHGMADPADEVMMQYAQQYDALFDLLKARSKEVVVIRAGEGNVHLFIAAFNEEPAIVIHTTAVET